MVSSPVSTVLDLGTDQAPSDLPQRAVSSVLDRASSDGKVPLEDSGVDTSNPGCLWFEA